MDELSQQLSVVLLVGLALVFGCEGGRAGGDRTAEEASVTSLAQGPGERVAFVHGYLRGSGQALQEGKPMLVLFTVPGCAYCQQMVREASADEQVVQLSKRFVCILVDADQEPETCRQFRVRAYPTVQFISPRGVPLNRLLGRTPPSQLAIQMRAALEATASRMRLAGDSAMR